MNSLHYLNHAAQQERPGIVVFVNKTLYIILLCIYIHDCALLRFQER